jgi:hypothetical protein
MQNENKPEIRIQLDGERIAGQPLRFGEAPEVFVYQGFRHTARSTASFIELVKRKGCAEGDRTVVAYTDQGIEAILDDSVKDRPQDTVTFGFTKSLELSEWGKVWDKPVDHKTLADFLNRQDPSQVQGLEFFIEAVRNFKYTSVIDGDFSYDDRNNYTFAVKIRDQEGSVKIPKTLFLRIPLIEESEFLQTIEVEVDFQKPRSEQEKVLFLLSCPKFPRYWREAVKHEIQKVKEELAGYLVVAGKLG